MYLYAGRPERLRQATADGALTDYAAVAAGRLSSHLDEAFPSLVELPVIP